MTGDKLFWPLNTTREGIPGPVVHGKNAVDVLQGSESRVLAIFPNHCMTNIELCDKGLTVEFWLWFTYTHDYVQTTVLKAGIGAGSRGFNVYLKYHHVCMQMILRTKEIRTCVGPLGKPTHWLHVLAYWDKDSALTMIGMT